MKILLLSDSFNSLTQRIYIELQQMGYDISVELAVNTEYIEEGISCYQPNLILCQMLTKIIPASIWEKIPLLIVHPGIKGDRGASSLDRAILEDKTTWGVTIVEASDTVDSGAIWATCEFSMGAGSKSRLYRNQVNQAAAIAAKLAVKRFEQGVFVPEPLDYSRSDVRGTYSPIVKQAQRSINWAKDPTAFILKKIRSADSNPGLLDKINEESYYLYGAHAEGKLVGKPGTIIAQSNGAICRATIDGAVWISHLKKAGKKKGNFKLPATMILANRLDTVNKIKSTLFKAEDTETYQEIFYEEKNDIGLLCFDFYNGAMSTEQCHRLRDTFLEVCQRPIKIIVLMGGRNFWSNGIHLNVIEAAESPADESWRNINAMDDLVEAILTTTDKLVVSAMYGSAGAGGVMLALAADRVFVREGVVLNPHYRSMGNLYGSEYWTYTLPRRVGNDLAAKITHNCLPMGTQEAQKIGLIDGIIYEEAGNWSGFQEQIQRIATHMAGNDYNQMLAKKADQRIKDEAIKPLSDYRNEELAKMKENFYGDDKSYHQARHNFVTKQPPKETPIHIAKHRSLTTKAEPQVVSENGHFFDKVVE